MRFEITESYLPGKVKYVYLDIALSKTLFCSRFENKVKQDFPCKFKSVNKI